jgi:uncharacterized protein with NAD-binding domain and iron-sulfur cluster
MRKRVAVLGAGVAGLTAAHELAERGFDVTVFENRPVPGGKARSMPVPNSGTEGRPDLPGEHGFRFFPGFYRHVPDTMKRIPYRGGTVFDNLVPASRIMIARRGGSEIVFPAHLPVSPRDVGLVMGALRRTGMEVPPAEMAYFVGRLTAILRTCDERRFRELEEQSWWEFSGAPQRSRAYQKFLADGLTRTLVAAKATEMSARTGGVILLRLLADMARVGKQVDRVLNGPTSDVWITPWVRYLYALGVDFQFDTRVIEIQCSGDRITGIKVRTPASEKGSGVPRIEEADYYVAAVPVEIMTDALVKKNDDLKKADPRLEDLANLETRWMNGVMLYFKTDVPLERGHTLYIDSEWALTSISQQQFWPGVDLSRMGDGRVKGILSVDVSDWDAPGTNGKSAKECYRWEIVPEVWKQLQQHLNDDSLPDLVDNNRLSAFIDPAIEWPNPTKATNAEQLLINTPGSWKWRPEAVTAIGNLFLAGDYVRTYTDLATMEGANEAARRAVNGILDASGAHTSKCDVWKPRDSLGMASLRAADRLWLELQPHVPTPLSSAWRP